MAGGIRSSQNQSISDINVTPLVDVVLVLLVIFMLAAPALYKTSIKVTLPEAATGEKAESAPLTFIIDQGGVLYWNQRKVAWTELNRELKSIDEASKNETVVISADTKTSHGLVIRLMDELRNAGLNQFSLSVKKKIN